MGRAPAKPTKRPLDPAAAQAAKGAARKRLEAQTAADQKWLDAQTVGMSADEKQEVFNQLSKTCSATGMTNGAIVLHCPIKVKLIYCMPGDPFTCPNGKAPGGAKGCALSPAVTDSLAKRGTKIDGVFVSAEEGGSYLSPYVPWGPISGKNGKAIMTSGNNSGVTIGTGVDLGAIKDNDKDKNAYIARLRAKGVSEQTLDKLRPLLGKHKGDACKALRDARGDTPLTFPQKDVELIDEDAMEGRAAGMKSAYNKQAKLAAAGLDQKIADAQRRGDATAAAALTKQRAALRGFDDLDSREQSILFSTYYHQGNISNQAIRPLVDSVMSGNDVGAQTALADKAGSAQSLIASRGKAELAYWTSHAPVRP